MSTKRQSVAEYFRDAPYFRTFEGIIGAKYYVKRNPHGSGLWFADEARELTIAKPREMDPDRKYSSLDDLLRTYPAHEDNTLEKYTFETIKVQPGDAIIDDILYLPSRMDDARYLEYHQGGKLIRFQILKHEFHAAYEYDDAQKLYRERPYRMKFATEDTILETKDSIEPVKKFATVKLKNDDITVDSLPPFSGIEERMVGGQEVTFYVKEAFNILGRPLDPGVFVIPGLAISQRPINGEMKFPNPFSALKEQFTRHAALFAEAKVFSSDNEAEFEAHRADIEKRFEYFEAHPFT